MKFLKNNINKIFFIISYVLIMYFFADHFSVILGSNSNTIGEMNEMTIIINTVIYVMLLVIGYILLSTEIKTDFEKLKKHDAMKLFLIILVAFIMIYVGNVIGNFLTMLFGGVGESQNEIGINEILLGKGGFFMIITTMFIGPIVEELVFRKSLTQTLRNLKINDSLIIFVVALIFGLIHVASAGDYVFIFPYFIMGLNFGILEKVTKNIYPGMILHILNNTIATIITIIMSIISGAFI